MMMRATSSGSSLNVLASWFCWCDYIVLKLIGRDTVTCANRLMLIVQLRRFYVTDSTRRLNLLKTQPPKID